MMRSSGIEMCHATLRKLWRELAWVLNCFDACRLLKLSKFMVFRTFSKIFTHSVLFQVRRLWLAVVSQAQCSVELRATLVHGEVRGVGNTVLVACFKYLFYSFSV